MMSAYDLNLTKREKERESKEGDRGNTKIKKCQRIVVRSQRDNYNIKKLWCVFFEASA